MISIYLEEDLNNLKFGLINRGFSSVNYVVYKQINDSNRFVIDFMFRNRVNQICRRSWRLSSTYDKYAVDDLKNWLNQVAPETETEKIARIMKCYE